MSSCTRLHSHVVLEPEKYGKQCNGFDVAEDFPTECPAHQNVSKLYVLQ